MIDLEKDAVNIRSKASKVDSNDDYFTELDKVLLDINQTMRKCRKKYELDTRGCYELDARDGLDLMADDNKRMNDEFYD